jgi:hypothetical protein
VEDVAVEIIDRLFSSIRSYFNSLKLVGHKNQSEVNKLLIYDFIVELLTENMRIFVNEADYRTIEKALYCLYGSTCLIPYPSYVCAGNNNLFGTLFSSAQVSPRISEDQIPRYTEDEVLRFKS